MKDGSTVLATFPGSTPAEQLVVCFERGSPGSHLRLRRQHWAEGIGWYDQQVLDLGWNEWSSLLAVLRSQAPRLPDRRAEPEPPPATIPFAAPADRSLRRRTGS